MGYFSFLSYKIMLSLIHFNSFLHKKLPVALIKIMESPPDDHIMKWVLLVPITYNFEE